MTNTKNKGSVIIDGVKIEWSDTRRSFATEAPGEAWDIESSGSYDVYVSSVRATPDAMSRALGVAQDMQVACDLYLACGEQQLELEGCDDMGDMLLRVYRGDKKCGLIPVRDLAHLDPDQYPDPTAKKAVKWMRDVALILRDKPRKEWHDAISMMNVR